MKNLVFLLLLLLSSCMVLAGEYEVLGLGSPCIDYILSVQDEDLVRMSLKKGEGCEMDVPALSALVEKCQEKMIFTGDCASNTIKGLACLGIPCALTGNVGSDSLGEHVRTAFTDLHVTTLFTETDTPTARIACLVTPDGQRSFCTFVQAEHEISEADLSAAQFEGVKLVHIEGYRLPNGMYMEKAMQLARNAGATISLDLANANLVKKFRERIFGLLETYTDILFLNEEEAYALTLLPPEKSAQFLKNFCPIVVVKAGDKGCWVCSKEEGFFHSPGIATKVVDTTGAGDLFASAFLYGYIKGYSIKTCAYFGNLAGSAAVERYGAELSPDKWSELKEKMK